MKRKRRRKKNKKKKQEEREKRKEKRKSKSKRRKKKKRKRRPAKHGFAIVSGEATVGTHAVEGVATDTATLFIYSPFPHGHSTITCDLHFHLAEGLAQKRARKSFVAAGSSEVWGEVNPTSFCWFLIVVISDSFFSLHD